MNLVPSSLLAAAAIVVALAGSLPQALAQNDPAMPAVSELKPMAAESTAWKPIRVRNVAPRILAWWLDPAHNTEPDELKQPRPFGQATQTKPPVNTGAFQLPMGIESIVPLDAQNALLVLGTESGMRKLEGIIAFLDKPMGQVEVEAQLVEIKTEDVKELGIEISQTAAPKADSKPAFSLGFVRGDFRSQLEKLKKQDKAKVVAAPRLTAINNLTTSIVSSTVLPATLAFKDEQGGYTQLGNNVLSLGRQFNFAVLPTINNDQTITLLLTPSTSLVLTGGDANASLVLRNLQSLETIANLKEGETIALSGFNMQSSNGLEDSKVAPANAILFVTAHIIRRVSDAEVEAVALTR